MALSSFSNVGYIPLALTDILASSISGFGDFFGFPLPSLYIGSFIFTYSPMIWSLGSSMITGASGGLKLKQFITPPVVGIFTGVLLSILGSGPLIADNSLPFHYIFGGLKTLGSVTSPLVLIVLGAMVGELEFSRTLSRKKMVFALSPMLIRYLALPAGLLLSLRTISALQNLTPAFLLILFMESIVPPAANFSIITKNAGKNEKETAMSLLVTYAAYLFIFPLYLMIFLHLLRF